MRQVVNGLHHMEGLSILRKVGRWDLWFLEGSGVRQMLTCS